MKAHAIALSHAVGIDRTQLGWILMALVATISVSLILAVMRVEIPFLMTMLFPPFALVQFLVAFFMMVF